MYKIGFLLDCLEDLKGDFDVIILGKRGEIVKFV